MCLVQSSAQGAGYVGFHDLAEEHRQQIIQTRADHEFGFKFVEHLAQLDTGWKEKYRSTFLCRAVTVVTETGLRRGIPCGRAWCPLCRRTQWGERYYPFVEGLQRLSDEGAPMYLVTLATRKCHALELRNRVEHMVKDRRKVFNQIREVMRRKGERFLYFWKLEGAVSRPKGVSLFQPHIHVITAGESQAQMLEDRWFRTHVRSNTKTQHTNRIVTKLGGDYAHMSGVERTLGYLSKGVVNHYDVRPQDADTIYQAFAGFHAHGGSRELRRAAVERHTVDDLTQPRDIAAVEWTKEGLLDLVTGELIAMHDLR